MKVGRRARCEQCEMTVMSMRSLEIVDREGLERMLDPTGLQRAFIAATGLDEIDRDGGRVM